MATVAQRHHMGMLMEYLIQHKDQVHYPPRDIRTQFDARSFTLSEQQLEHLIAGGGSIQADCSEITSWICEAVGLKDPNGLHYRYAGYTGTMLSNPLMAHYFDPKHAQIGALVVFGPGTGEHVAMVKKPDHKNPRLFSHGGEFGPIEIPLLDETRYHNAPVTFLSIAHL